MNRPIRIIHVVHRFEDLLLTIGLLLMAVFPLIEIGSRAIGIVGLSGSTDYVRHLTLWVTFMGAIVAAREGQHLSLHAGLHFLPHGIKGIVKITTTVIAAAVCGLLGWAGLGFVRSVYGAPTQIAGWLPQWVAIVIMPIGYISLVPRLIWRCSDRWTGRLTAAIGLIVAGAFGLLLEPIQGSHFLLPGMILLIIAGVLGGPIFSVIGGIALLLFFAEDVSIAAIPVEAYRIVASPVLPTVPLFALAGYILAKGGASRRFVRLFRALFGWMPGGVAVAATCACTFFTTFTGASGVTILALGGILLPVLLENGYTKRFSIGLLTTTGSLGLLFPPSLPVIFYGTISHTPIDKLFIAGLIPGLLLFLVISLFAMRHGLRSSMKSTPFKWHEAASALWESKWEVALPVVVLFGIFGGYTTLVEASAVTVIYALIAECFIYKDIRIRTDLIPTFTKSGTLIGGILIILSVAMGLTSYMVDAQIPLRAADWVRAHVESRNAFLLMLNLFLLIVGCLMDIFSAIAVVVPLIIPIAQVYNIHPLHLGIIFLANLELGYLHPPVGMNLFMSSLRFDQSIMRVFLDTIPFFLLLLVVVLLITYVPLLTLCIAGR